MSAKLVNNVGFVEKESDDHITKLKRSLALDWACSLDYENCTSNLEKQFYPWLEDDIKNPYVIVYFVSNAERRILTQERVTTRAEARRRRAEFLHVASVLIASR